MRQVSRILMLITLAAALSVGWSLVMAGAANHNHGASAGNHAATCEVCGKPLVARSQVDLKATGETKEHHYRCIHCALVAANDWFKSDVTLRTRSAGQGQAVTWARHQGKWQVSPAAAEVLVLPETNGECVQTHLVFASASEFQSYRKTHSSMGGHKPLGGTQVPAILAAGKEPAPKEATCPVSGKKFQPTAKTEWTVYQGKTYYFCCGKCKPQFESQPAAYASGHGPKPQHAMAEGGCGGHQGGGCATEKGGNCAGHAKSGGPGAGKSPAKGGAKAPTRKA